MSYLSAAVEVFVAFGLFDLQLTWFWQDIFKLKNVITLKLPLF